MFKNSVVVLCLVMAVVAKATSEIPHACEYIANRLNDAKEGADWRTFGVSPNVAELTHTLKACTDMSLHTEHIRHVTWMMFAICTFVIMVAFYYCTKYICEKFNWELCKTEKHIESVGIRLDVTHDQLATVRKGVIDSDKRTITMIELITGALDSIPIEFLQITNDIELLKADVAAVKGKTADLSTCCEGMVNHLSAEPAIAKLERMSDCLATLAVNVANFKTQMEAKCSGLEEKCNVLTCITDVQHERLEGIDAKIKSVLPEIKDTMNEYLDEMTSLLKDTETEINIKLKSVMAVIEASNADNSFQVVAADE